MSSQHELTIRSESVERIYDMYASSKFVVNRQYQRKLVWTVQEKEAFIDSISHGYPIPLILVAEVSHDNKPKYELIDGLQRLDAIVSFIQGRVHLGGQFFNLEAMAATKLALDSGDLSQKTPVLGRETCKEIASYVVPLSIFRFEGRARIDEIFRRINTNGRHLSRQELRQAGVVSLFAQLVRRLSSKIRGDASHTDLLALNQMQQISISNRGLNYGIGLYDIPWVKHNIISFNNIRESRDEELVGHLLARMLLGIEVPPAAFALDVLYGFSNDKSVSWAFDVDESIKKHGMEALENRFVSVHEQIQQVLRASKRGRFDKWIFRQRPRRISQHYQVIFAAFDELLFVRRKKIADYVGLSERMRAIGDSTIQIKALNNEWNQHIREECVNAVVGRVQDLFVDRELNDPALETGVTQLDNLLVQSQTEQSLYDFKIGFHRLHGDAAFDEDALSKVAKTLAAMANQSRDSVGYVVVGIADRPEHAARAEEFWKISATKSHNFYVVGIEGEAAQSGGIDKYFSSILQRLRNAPISPPSVVDQICRDIRMYRYYSHSVLVIKVCGGTEPSMYDKKIFIRHGPSVQEVDPSVYAEVYRRFLHS